MEKSYISRKEQAQLTKKKIFDTTMMLIHKKGYSKITIREICTNAQISIGTFYIYFSSKDDILLEIYHKIDQKTVFPEVLSDIENQNYSERICEYFSIHFRCMIETQERELLREIYKNALISGENYFLNPDRPLYRSVFTLLTSAEKKGALRLASANTLCEKLFLYVQSYVYQWLICNELTSAFLTEVCISDLKLYLSLYIQDNASRKSNTPQQADGASKFQRSKPRGI